MNVRATQVENGEFGTTLGNATQVLRGQSTARKVQFGEMRATTSDVG